jgi:hypothetical protein
MLLKKIKNKKYSHCFSSFPATQHILRFMCLTFVKRDYIHLLLYFFQSECIIFILLQRDPMLLLLFLMGRTPHLLVPDDIDPTDYEVSVSVLQ